METITIDSTMLSVSDGTLILFEVINGLFPTNIGDITMDWNTTDEIETFEVTFAYDWWNVSGGTTGDGGTNV